MCYKEQNIASVLNNRCLISLSDLKVFFNVQVKMSGVSHTSLFCWSSVSFLSFRPSSGTEQTSVMMRSVRPTSPLGPSTLKAHLALSSSGYTSRACLSNYPVQVFQKELTLNCGVYILRRSETRVFKPGLHFGTGKVTMATL